MSLEGLTNDNGFYSDHYLAEVFAGDIGDTLARWRARADQVRETRAAVAGGAASAMESLSDPGGAKRISRVFCPFSSRPKRSSRLGRTAITRTWGRRRCV